MRRDTDTPPKARRLLLLVAVLACTAICPLDSQGTFMQPDSFFNDKGPVRFPLQPPEQHFNDPSTRALVAAALRGDAAELRAAVAKGASPNAEGVSKPGSRFAFTPLHYAIAAGNLQAARLLVAVGADPEHRAAQMGSPLLFAITLNNPEWLGSLLDLKPVAQLAAPTQQQLLFEAARRGAPGCLTLLIQRGVPIDLLDTAGYSLLLRSLDMGLYDLSLWLLQQGASATVQPDGGPSVAKSVAIELAASPKDGWKYQKLLEIQALLQTRSRGQ